MHLPKACVLDASVLLDYYRHISGADSFPEAVALVDWAVANFESIHAEFQIGHSKFATALEKIPRLAEKLRMVSRMAADRSAQLPPEADAAVDELFKRVLGDGELLALRAQRADHAIRSLDEDLGYVIRLALISRPLNAAVLLSKHRTELAKAIGRCSVHSTQGGNADVTLTTIEFLRDFKVVFAGQSFVSLGGKHLGFSLVLKGGGMKGIAFAGALQELEPYFAFDTYVGTSAGAIAAALLGSGYTARELETVMTTLQLRQFVKLNPFAMASNFFFRGGLFDAGLLQEWVERKLRQKKGLSRDVMFADITADIRIAVSTRRRGTVVFGKRSHPRNSVSYAVRCSASIPFFFTPGNWEGDIAVDGGVQQNLPIRPYFEGSGDDRVIILSLNSPMQQRTASRTGPLWRIVSGVAAIWITQDEDSLTAANDHALISIDTGAVRATQLSLKPRERDFLLTSGRLAAVKFLQKRGIPALDSRRTELEQCYNRLVSKSR